MAQYFVDRSNAYCDKKFTVLGFHHILSSSMLLWSSEKWKLFSVWFIYTGISDNANLWSEIACSLTCYQAYWPLFITGSWRRKSLKDSIKLLDALLQQIRNKKLMCRVLTASNCYRIDENFLGNIIYSDHLIESVLWFEWTFLSEIT